MRYTPFTEYDGFTTDHVITNEDGSQHVWLDNGDHFSLVWVHNGEAIWIKDLAK